jgi:hypothetical protein
MPRARQLRARSKDDRHRGVIPFRRGRERIRERRGHLVRANPARLLFRQGCTLKRLPLRARSSIDAFEKLGYTFLYSYRELEALELYRAFPKLVQIVIMDAVLINNCLHFDRPQRVPLREITSGRFRQSSREEWESFGLPEVESGAGEVYWAESMMEGKERHEGCIRRVDYPEGIPIWKTLS